MPNERFATWFRRSAGSGMKIGWRVDARCSMARRTPGRSICVVTTASSLDVLIFVRIYVNTEKGRVSSGRPGAESIEVYIEGEGAFPVLTLSALPAKRRELGLR